jgi:hypothetical protein
MLRIAGLSAILAAAFAVPASAEYYIVHGPDRRCRVVETYSPSERDLVRVGPLSITTREEAERQVKVVCREGYYRDGGADVRVEREIRREERR